jgi:LmbE family N-acetylglucosaminyl deacetylase
VGFSSAQTKSAPAGEILLDLKKLNKLGSVLYLAAHPDDENTRMISYFANEKCLRTAYLSLTRGDGGQNLIGPEKAEKMGLIRTQELLEARKTDGGIQFFTRANDFGYSKHPDETLKIWNKEAVLSDVVWVIRKFRPDIIITRFSPDRAGKTHGHHTSSAMLAKEAFELAGDKNAFPEQLEFVEVWQAKRIFWNTSWWFYRDQEFDKSGLITVDVGAYNPLLGRNYGEIAGASRSMHKSQGFGASQSKGSIEEYLELIGGEEAITGPMEGINTGWDRVKGGDAVEKQIDEAFRAFDPQYPSVIVRHLINARNEIMKLKDPFWREIKLSQIEDLILNCVGFSAEAIADDYRYSPGDSLSFTFEAINRSLADISITNLELVQNGFKDTGNIELPYNQMTEKNYRISIPANAELSNPYWLIEDYDYGLYTVNDPRLIGMPESPANLSLGFTLKMGDTEIKRSIPFVYRRVDRVRGELYRDVAIAPPVCVNFLEKTLIFGNRNPKTLKVAVLANRDNLKAKVKFNLPSGWSAEPSEIRVEINNKGEQKFTDIEIRPSGNAENGLITALADIDGKEYEYSNIEIEYEHIKAINYFPKAQMPLVSIDLKTKGTRIGYVKGAGDDVPEALLQMGYIVEFLDEVSLIQNELSQYDAIIMGIRAYNTQPWLYDAHEKLMKYVSGGGNMIIQYNTNRGLNFDKIGPYPFELGRTRVTVEEAEIRTVIKNHSVLTEPNSLNDKDFGNWVQERGLYFASSWDERYETPFESNDPGEEPSKGMLITTKYGEGYFTYTGISFFRQLPAGVPGAYRLFANLIARGQ